MSRLIGNQSIQTYLQKAVKNGIVPHAQLWVGPEHVGKTTFLTNYLHWLKVDLQVGVQWYQGSELEMETARHLIQTTTETHLWSGPRFIVIEEAEQLRYQVYNALLKVLEEPRSRVTLVLLANDLEPIPETVRSRCSTIWFQRVSNAELVATAPDQAQSIPLAHGLPGIVLSWKKAGANQRWLQAIAHWVEVLQQTPVERLAAVSDKDVSKDIRPALTALETAIYGVLSVQTKVSAERYPDSLQQPLQQLALKAQLADSVQALRSIAQARRSLAQPVQTKFVFSNLLLNIYPNL